MRPSKSDHRSLIAGVLSDSPGPAVREIIDRGIWSRVALDAWRQRVGGVFLRRLENLNAPIPEDASRELNAYARHVLEANRIRLRRVMPVIDQFADAGIPCVLLKGAALLASIYSDWSLRPMVDVDLLIDPSNAAAAERILQKNDWRPGEALVRPDFFPRYHYEREYLTRSEPAVRIDLHVRPFRPLRYATRIPESAFSESVATVALCGRSVNVPNAEVMLIHLGAHAAFHGANELRWLYDIYAWLKHCGPALDVPAVVRSCAAWKLSHPLRFALSRVRATLGAVGMLDSIFEALPRRAGLADRLVLWQAPHGESRHAMDVAVNALTLSGWRHRWSYLSAVALPDHAHLAQIYSPRHVAWPLAAQLVRLGRLASRPFARRIAS